MGLLLLTCRDGGDVERGAIRATLYLVETASVRAIESTSRAVCSHAGCISSGVDVAGTSDGKGPCGNKAKSDA